MNDDAKLLGTGLLAEELGVRADVLKKWVERYPPSSRHPFPRPDEVIHGRDGRVTYGWRQDRVPEIRGWMTSRGESETDRFLAGLEELDQQEPGSVRRLYRDQSGLFELLTNEQKVAVNLYLEEVESSGR